MKRFYLLPLVCCALSISLSAQENNGTATTSGADDNRILSADSLITTDARLDSLYQTLPEVMITGERPIVKAAQGKLVYDLPRLIRNLPVDNAYDAVKELPGVIEMNGGLQLAGQGVTVILDGKVTTLSTGQLYALLRSIPASRIEKAEVMYNAPARYQVRGALINITLKQSAGNPAIALSRLPNDLKGGLPIFSTPIMAIESEPRCNITFSFISIRHPIFSCKYTSKWRLR